MDRLAALLELAVPHEDIDALISMRLGRAEQRLIDDRVQILVEHMGSDAIPPRFEVLPDQHPLFYAQVYLAARPHVRAYHQSLGIPAAISRLTLTDVGRSLAVHRRRTGHPGMDPVHWLMLHFTGRRYQLGRLQFEQATLGGRTSEAMGQPGRHGEPVLSVHIPEFCGPLSPSACDRSVSMARHFFKTHFPFIGYQMMVCHSWLLDSQLQEVLPPRSNILAFQRRFPPIRQGAEDDGPILRFVSAGTPLHDKVLAHIAAGRHWRTGSGWAQL